MQFESAVLESLVRALRTRRNEADLVIVPIRWWVDGDAICLVYENPPRPGLHGLRRSLAFNPLTDEERKRDSAAWRWAYDIALPDLWTREPPHHLYVDLVGEGQISWWGNLRDELPVALREPDFEMGPAR